MKTDLFVNVMCCDLLNVCMNTKYLINTVCSLFLVTLIDVMPFVYILHNSGYTYQLGPYTFFK